MSYLCVLYAAREPFDDAEKLQVVVYKERRKALGDRHTKYADEYAQPGRYEQLRI